MSLRHGANRSVRGGFGIGERLRPAYSETDCRSLGEGRRHRRGVSTTFASRIRK
jgi:hypothetical protein